MSCTNRSPSPSSIHTASDVGSAPHTDSSGDIEHLALRTPSERSFDADIDTHYSPNNAFAERMRRERFAVQAESTPAIAKLPLWREASPHEHVEDDRFGALLPLLPAAASHPDLFKRFLHKIEVLYDNWVACGEKEFVVQVTYSFRLSLKCIADVFMYLRCLTRIYWGSTRSSISCYNTHWTRAGTGKRMRTRRN